VCVRVQVVLSEEDLAVVEQASATAAEVTGSMMRLKLELDEKKRTVNMLQTALVNETHTYMHISSSVCFRILCTTSDDFYLCLCEICNRRSVNSAA